MKTILVTGGAGFIGSHLCDYLLKNNYRVINVDNFNDFYDPSIKRNNVSNHLKNPNYILLEGDIRNYPFMEDCYSTYTIDAVVHLAAMAGVRPSIADPLLYEDVNVRGTMHLLELNRKYEIKKFVCASSSSVYGNNEKTPFSESDPVDYCISPYASTKKSCEIISHVYHHLYDIDVAMLRFFTVYGPRQRPDLAIHKFTHMMREGEEVPFYGDGSTRRDYTYIDDIIDGTYKALSYIMDNSSVYEIFNLGESQTISLAEMVKTIENQLGVKARIKQLPMQQGDVEQTFADISKAKQLIGYNPQTKFEAGIEKFIRWYDYEKQSILY
ncbi:GDP-mannose 4,6-dehydratase [Paenibacillus sacheonensis]|uniref:NAD-dependent epimerase/dehydratase family protein n=1 Tax=Paenibacillus sacheonensis TaxID=742054 RepID=A0A7X4YP12_9BACL|nr:GDP-mannose 4,6-dehydratase [Paenibacillus sacheonensis]MBM7567320.1 UDP-glucuronate 4-epimerase [Paenibacillus sacheonensis]NBC69896.1 NAD-dependent epimerase/dehydratase family protein [Paenibacillus sacheonensis]